MRERTIGIRATKMAAMKYVAAAEKEAVASIPEIMKTVFATEDFKEGLLSFKERRAAHFQGK